MRGARSPPSAPSASTASTPGWPQGLTPGVDPEATPACVNSCIAEALAFGDIDDPQSNVSQLLAENQHFRMHEELGTGPGFYYLWDRNRDMSYGPNPWQQTHWDWRAAGNFMCGGAGGGLIVFAALSGVQGLAADAAGAGGRWGWSASACCASGSRSAARCAR